MIVRNEAAVIDRCLDSVRGLIDTYTVVDTGSTDGTPERITSALAGVPGTLHHRPWRDFGANRTELMQLARGSADYLLLLDADMTLRIDGALGALQGDGYLLVHDGSLHYRVPRLVRGDVDWRFVGATHEYLDGGSDHRVTETLAELVVEHHADGGSRADKFERDRRLLEAAVDADPDDARSWFYLAQTYADLGETDPAIDAYRRRVALGGWPEEVFVAQLRLGDLLATGSWAAAVPEYLAAWQVRPTRAEALYRLARGYRAREQYFLAGVFAATGLTVPLPDDVLFVEREPYDWGLLFEHSIAAYWCGDARSSIEASTSLLDGRAPEWLVPWVTHNLTAAGGDGRTGDRVEPSFGWMADDAAATERLGARITGVRFELLEVDPAVVGDAGWSVFNPSVARLRDGFAAVLRRANYVIGPDGDYDTIDGSADITSHNVLRRFSRDWRTRSDRPLEALPSGPAVHDFGVHGVEDARLVSVDGHAYALGACRDRNAEGRCQTVLWDLEPAGTGPDAATRAPHLRILEGPDHLLHEKNWMPFVVDGQLHAVYSCSPLTVVRIDVATGSVDEVARTPSPDEARHLRGGSQGVEYRPGRWIFVAHEVCRAPDDPEGRVYVHRFVEVVAGNEGPTFRLRACSERFSFTGAAIEFCAGAVLDGADLVLSVGVDDAQALLVRAPLDEVLRMLDVR